MITQIEAFDFMSKLGRELVIDYVAEDLTVSDIVTDLLEFQGLEPTITVGTISAEYASLTRSIWVDSESILSTLNKLRETVGGYIEVDNDYKLNWYSSIGEDKGQQIRYRKNLTSITREIDYSSMANRIYAYGAGEGTARIKLSDVKSALTDTASAGQKTVKVEDASLFEVGLPITISDDIASENNVVASITGNTVTTVNDLIHTYTVAAHGKVGWKNDYIEDTASQTEWSGIYPTVLVEKSITHPETLKEWALLKLEELKEPVITYQVNAVDLSEVSDWEHLQLGSQVTVIDEELGIDVKTTIVKITHPDLIHQEQMEIELSTKAKDITDKLLEVYDTVQLDSHIATKIGAGQVVVLGDFTVKDWVTEGKTTIIGSHIQTGTITATQLSTGEIITQTAQIKDGIITDAKISNLNASKITAGTISADRIASSSITATKLSVTKLDSITSDMGTITAGEIRLGSGTVGTDFTGLRLYKSGTTYRMEGVNAGTPQAYFDSDGKLKVGQATIVMDKDGISISSNAYSTNFKLTRSGYSTAYLRYDGSTFIMNMGLRTGGAVVPDVTDSYNLGSASLKWNYLYANYIGDSSNKVSTIYANSLGNSSYYVTSGYISSGYITNAYIDNLNPDGGICYFGKTDTPTSFLPTTSNKMSLGIATKYWYSIYSNIIRYKDLASFQHHDDISLIKSISTQKKGKKEVFDNLPEEVIERVPDTGDYFIDAGAMQGLTIGTLKQLIERVEKIEAKLASGKETL